MIHKEIKMLMRAMGLEDGGKLNSKEAQRISRAARIFRKGGPLNTKDADALRGALKVMVPEDGGEKSE